MNFGRIKTGFPGSAGLWLSFVAIAGLRVAYSVLPLPSGDGGLYLAAASRLLNGGYFFSGGRETFELLYRTPGYPLFLALVSWLSGNSALAVALVQHLIGVLSAYAAYRVGLRAWGRPAALMGALFTGLHFHFVYAESYPLSEALAVFLLLAAIYLVMELNSDDKAGPPAFAVGGLLLACGALCRPEIAGLAPLCAVYFWSGRRAPAALKLVRISAYLLPVVMLLGAWTLRNGLLFDYWGITPNARIAFFDGPAGMCVQAPQVEPDIIGAQALVHQNDYGRVNRAVNILEGYGIPYQWSARRIGALARGAVAERPGTYLSLSLRQLREMLFTGPTWPPRDITETMPELFAAGAGTRTSRILGMLGRVDGGMEGIFLAPLFLAGCAAALFLRSKDALLLAASAAYLLATYAFLAPVSPRYRIVVEPLMGLLAASAVSIAWYRLARTRTAAADPAVKPAPGWISSPWPAIVLAVSFCVWSCFMAGLFKAYRARSLSFSPEAAPLLRAAAAEPADKEAFLRLGEMSFERAMYPGALGYFDKALKLDPGNKAAADGRAAALFKMGLGKAALEELRRGMALYKNSPDLYYNAAVIGYLSGDVGEVLKDLSVFLGFRDIPPALRARALAMQSALQAPSRAPERGLQKVRH